MYAFTRARCLDTVVESVNATYLKFGLPVNYVVVGDVIVPVVSVVKLGVHFDSHMTMRHHVDTVCKMCSFRLRRIKSVRPFTTKRACHTLVIALVSPNLDYCNALLLDLAEYRPTRLLKIHNKAARLVILTHVTPVLVELHWLLVKQRIQLSNMPMCTILFT